MDFFIADCFLRSLAPSVCICTTNREIALERIMKTPWTSLILVFPLDNKKKGRILVYCFCFSLTSKESWFMLGFLVSGVVCNTTHAMIAWQKTVFARNWQRIILIIATKDVVNVVRICTVKFALESEPFSTKLMFKNVSLT